MPIVVHLTDTKLVASIQRAGIRPGKYSSGVYLMPVVQNFMASHQWLRELKRSGARTLAGVYVRLPADEQVWAGHYSKPHEQLRLGTAIRLLRELPDPLGFEMYLERKIAPSEIHSVRNLPQVIGWRYQPHSHSRVPCGCPMCLPRGSIKSRMLRERLEPKGKRPSLDEIRKELEAAVDDFDFAYALEGLRNKRRQIDPAFLLPLLDSGSERVLEALALSLQYLRHPKTPEMLARLAEHPTPAIAAIATDALEAYSAGRIVRRRPR